MILALDLASVTGWACGKPGGTPGHGSIRFASPGASHEAIFANAHHWMQEHMRVYNPRLIVWEAPMPTSFSRGMSNVNTTTLLYGLPAVIGTVAYLREVYDIRKASTRDIRNHFIGHNPKGHVGKKLVMKQCRMLGWGVADDNEADALATWSFMCALIDPATAVRPTALLGRQFQAGSPRA